MRIRTHMHMCKHKRISLLGKVVGLSPCVCMRVHMQKNNIHSVEQSCGSAQNFSLRTHAGSMITEPVHTVRLSEGNVDENCHCLVPIHEHDWWWYAACRFHFWKIGCTHHLCHLFLFMAVAATEAASISSFFSSSSSSNNLQNTAVPSLFFDLIWVYSMPDIAGRRCHN